MGTETGRDFASLLDELIAESAAEEQPAARPHIAFDYLSVADELHSGRIKVSADAAAAEYRLTAAEEASHVLFAAIGEARSRSCRQFRRRRSRASWGFGCQARGAFPQTPLLRLQEPSRPRRAPPSPARHGQDAGRQHADRRGGTEGRAARSRFRQLAVCIFSHFSTMSSSSSRPSTGLRKLLRAAATSAASVPSVQDLMTRGWM